MLLQEVTDKNNVAFTYLEVKSDFFSCMVFDTCVENGSDGKSVQRAIVNMARFSRIERKITYRKVMQVWSLNTGLVLVMFHQGPGRNLKSDGCLGFQKGCQKYRANTVLKKGQSENGIFSFSVQLLFLSKAEKTSASYLPVEINILKNIIVVIKVPYGQGPDHVSLTETGVSKGYSWIMKLIFRFHLHVQKVHNFSGLFLASVP